MAITYGPPRTIHLGGDITPIHDREAVEAITPGMLLEPHQESDILKWGVHDSADAAAEPVFALQQTLLNLGIDDDYADGDLVQAGHFHRGAYVYAIVPSGQNITAGDTLQSNGDGKLKALATGVHIATADETIGAVTADTRLRATIV